MYTTWERKEKISNGVVTMTVYDAANIVRSKVEPKPLKLPPMGILQFVCAFRPANHEPGIYRIDLFRDGLPIWRASFAIVD